MIFQTKLLAFVFFLHKASILQPMAEKIAQGPFSCPMLGLKMVHEEVDFFGLWGVNPLTHPSAQLGEFHPNPHR